jgi:hypothetical protein
MDWISLPVSAELGSRDVEGRKLGPLNINAADVTRSMLGTDPWREELRLDPKLGVRDLDVCARGFAFGLLLLPKRDVMYLWNLTRGFDRRRPEAEW